MIALNKRFNFAMILVLASLFLSDFSLVFAEEFRYDSHGKRDPFLAPGVEDITGSQLSHGELRLEGIVLDNEGQSYAIVNSEIVREGQTFQGFLLKKITAQEVTFQKNDDVFNIQLRQDDELMKQYSKKK